MRNLKWLTGPIQLKTTDNLKLWFNHIDFAYFVIVCHHMKVMWLQHLPHSCTSFHIVHTHACINCTIFILLLKCTHVFVTKLLWSIYIYIYIWLVGRWGGPWLFWIQGLNFRFQSLLSHGKSTIVSSLHSIISHQQRPRFYRSSLSLQTQKVQRVTLHRILASTTTKKKLSCTNRTRRCMYI